MSTFQTPEEKPATTSNSTPANVQIYDRPEKKKMSPVIIALIVIVLLILAGVLYKTFVH